jgi:23S rRNA (pseudouridine1915-N3)-methyltransferase
MKIEIVRSDRRIKKYYAEAIAEYTKRLSGFCEILYVDDKNAKSNSRTVVISTKGTAVTSEEFAAKIAGYMGSGSPDIKFIFKENSTDGAETMSLSRMDMDPGLQAALLCEQIYRAYRILTDQPYHK